MTAEKSHVQRSGVAPARRWRRRLRTCGIVSVVAMTVLLAAVYVASWRVTLFAFYIAQGSSQRSCIAINVKFGVISFRAADDSDLAGPYEAPGQIFCVVTLLDRGEWIPTKAQLINLPWLAVNWGGPFTLRLEIPLAVLVALSAGLVTRRVRTSRAARNGRIECPKCGYDLSGLPREPGSDVAVCPECGKPRAFSTP